MQKAHLLLSSAIIFWFCCSMSQCQEDKTPGPETTVHGFVHEAKTGLPLANIQLRIVKNYPRFLEPDGISYYDVTTTGADGRYDLKFTPLGKGTFRLEILHPPFFYLPADTIPLNDNAINGLKLGAIDSLNFILAKYLKLQVHLTNKSNQNRKAFHGYILDDDNPNYPFNTVYSETGVGRVVIDTVLPYYIPQLSHYTYQSIFYNPILSGPDVGGYGDSLSFKKNFYLGKSDTTITIVNP